LRCRRPRKTEQPVTTNKQNLKALHDAGVRLGFGSASGVGLRIPGVAEHLELALMVEAGLTPMQAITSATLQCGGAAEAR
jgi:imidazolonepropionase-like amidohydrolase